MECMFNGATAFNQYIANWSVDNVTSCGSFSTNSPLTEANTPTLPTVLLNLLRYHPAFLWVLKAPFN